MRTSRNPCCLSWQWIVLNRNAEFIVGLGGVVYVEHARGTTGGDWRDRGGHTGGREPGGIPLRGGGGGGRIGDESLRLDFGETVFEQYRRGERGSALRQS